MAALASLVIASLGVTAPGRALLRGAIGFWPGFAVLRDAQQFIAPLALAEALGFGLAVAWCMQPRSFGAKETTERPGPPPRSPAPPDPLGLVLGVLALLTPLLLLPGLAWGAAGASGPPGTRPVTWPRPARSTTAGPPAPSCCCPGSRTGRLPGTTAR